MNFLLFALLRALRCYAWLRLLAAAFIWSSLGNGLTQVVVFGQLLQWQACSPSPGFLPRCQDLSAACLGKRCAAGMLARYRE
ncbi:hypothetical protein AO703_00720 [[Enterobacter] lignolyticus]|uniref:Uncharacterized protein n=1 Tax=[Enterobacter] lignolyticus TaxID=1334193 RepID=A0A806X7Y1_9ENTR|nr:hypothetical protein AO703_00720 [[Enterobacter] lignolyticus]